MIHIDDWLDAPPNSEGEAYAKKCLEIARLPAMERWSLPDSGNFKLFCTFRGNRYRCTGASRMGDVWLAKNFSRDTGYDHRVDVAECSEWSDDAVRPARKIGGENA